MSKAGRPKQLTKSEEPTRMVCTRFSPETLAALERIGKEQDRSISWLVRKAADELVQRSKAKNKNAGTEAF